MRYRYMVVRLANKPTEEIEDQLNVWADLGWRLRAYTVDDIYVELVMELPYEPGSSTAPLGSTGPYTNPQRNRDGGGPGLLE